MKMLLYIFCIVAVAAMTSCQPYKTITSSYIQAYYVPTGFTSDTQINPNNVEIEVTVKGSLEYFVYVGGEKKNIYNKYANYNGDTNYQRDEDNWGGPISSCNPLSSISVTCNADWDAAHPAGTSLNDLFSVKVGSARKYIESNYKVNDYSVCSSKLSELKYTDIQPFTDWIVIYTSSKPEMAGLYELTIRVEFEKDPINGNRVSCEPAKVKVEF